jgi:hypothetical protein
LPSWHLKMASTTACTKQAHFCNKARKTLSCFLFTLMQDPLMLNLAVFQVTILFVQWHVQHYEDVDRTCRDLALEERMDLSYDRLRNEWMDEWTNEWMTVQPSLIRLYNYTFSYMSPWGWS